jgi:RecA/RadA recombinase
MARPKKEKEDKDGEEDKGPKNPFTQILDLVAANNYQHYGIFGEEELSQYKDEIISTGSARMDALLGGGFRPGMSLFFGDEETGKTAQGLMWGKQWQDKYGDKAWVILLDAEGRCTKFKLEMSGINLDRFTWVRSNLIEDTFDLIDKLVCNNTTGMRYFFILDSLDALLRKEDREKSFGDAPKVAGGAAIQSMAGKRLSNPIHGCGHHLYQISQIRVQNLMGGKGDGAKPSGGKAPKFYADIIGRMYKGWSDTFIKEGSAEDAKIIGNKTKIKLVKSYNETSNIDIDIPIKLGHKGGVWREYEAFLMSQEWGFIEKKGAWYNFSELFQKMVASIDPTLTPLAEKKVQGETNMIRFFEDNLALVAFMEAQVKAMSA